MFHHLSTTEVKKLCVNALPEDELIAAALHTAECQSCHYRFVEELKRQRGSAPFNFTLEPEFWFRHDHVDFGQLVALADKTLDHGTEEIIDIHLKTCDTCREDVRCFLAFRNATAGDIKVSYGQIDYESTYNDVAPSRSRRLPRIPVYAAAASLLVAVAVLIAVIGLNRRSGSLEAGKQDQTNLAIDQGPSTAPSPTSSLVSSSPSAGHSTKIAILKDRGGEITIDKNGYVTGLEGISANSREYVARAALAQQIEPADVLGRLASEQSGLRGNNDRNKGFRLLYPVRSVVIEDRPVFRWASLPNVSSYRVYVMDADGNQVGQSEELPPTKTEWKVPAPLGRGQIFSWAVTAVVDGKKVVSPSASTSEMKFAVLSTEDFRELVRVKKSNSHLGLGVFYARIGLLNEAEHEFQSLVKLNPELELPRKLLQSVRRIRKD